MENNPFTYGNPISDPTRFFGRQDEVIQIFSRLCNAEFESSSLIGERRVGKTSLINYLRDEHVRHSYGLSPEQYIFIYLNLHAVTGEITPVRLWKWLIEEMASCCRDITVRPLLEEITKTASIDSLMLTNMFSAIEKKGQRVVFLLDEFDSITRNQNFGLDFFHILRVLAQQRTLALITSSRRDLIDLCHSDDISSSPFFNIFVPFYLRPFSEDEARNLVFRLLQKTRIRFSEADIHMIFQVGGTHPYFLQMACACLFEEYSRPLHLRSYFLVRKKFEERARLQFQDYWDISSDQEKIALTTLALLDQQNKKQRSNFFIRKKPRSLPVFSSQTLERLERRCLVVSITDKYRLFNESFAYWIYKEITDTVQDPQSYEDWLASNKSLMDRLSTSAKREIGQALPKIASKYRELIITWVSDPKGFAMAVELLKATLHFH